jgi:hypothetical protein
MRLDLRSYGRGGYRRAAMLRMKLPQRAALIERIPVQHQKLRSTVLS